MEVEAKMRVALISPLFESVPPRLYGGTERVIYNLCRGLTEADIEVSVFASGDSSIEGRIVPVVEEAFRLRKTPVTDPSSYHFKMLAMVAERAREYDIIHNHHDYWMLPLSQMIKTPLLTTLHGRLDLPDITSAFQSFSKCSYISISDNQRTPLSFLNWERTIHHGLDIAQFKFHPKPGKYLAFLGRMTFEKRPEWAIEIAKLSGVPLKIAAKIDGPDGQQFYDRFIRPHVDGKFIEYVGEITESEKSEFLGNALALAFPIDWPEPFGLVVPESLACGTPVLARPCGSVPELLQNGITGFIDADIRVLAKRIRDLSKISRYRCRQWAEERFSLRRMTEEYVDVYRKLSNRARGSADHRRYLLHTV
jgi:glycosyltransferase involved in cell wall biosynthesis